MKQFAFLCFLIVIFSRLVYIQITEPSAVPTDLLLWPNKTLCYRFHENFTEEQKAEFYECFKWINSTTCIRFVPAAENQTNCVHITGNNTGCNSQVGYLHRPQYLNIPFNNPGIGCMRRGYICHEFMHALGFFHEHNRCDRDSRVCILKSNIKEGSEQQFITQCYTRIVTPYDTCSCLHYRNVIFSKNGLPTIIACNNETIGQRECLSPLDVEKMNIIYKCNMTTLTSPYICAHCSANPPQPPKDAVKRCAVCLANSTFLDFLGFINSLL